MLYEDDVADEYDVDCMRMRGLIIIIMDNFCVILPQKTKRKLLKISGSIELNVCLVFLII